MKLMSYFIMEFFPGQISFANLSRTVLKSYKDFMSLWQVYYWHNLWLFDKIKPSQVKQTAKL